MHLMRKKPIQLAVDLTKEEGKTLKRSLTTFDLIAMGVGGSIGAGIFSITATTAANYSGPSVIVSFLIASVLCGLIAFCYSEFASILPVSGSAYTFAYISLGEFIAWIIGWDLILEILFTASLVVKAWSTYFYDLIRMLHININPVIDLHFQMAKGTTDWHLTIDFGCIFIVLFVAIFVSTGAKMSAKAINVITVIKLVIILFLIIAGLFFIHKQNYFPFIPDAQPTTSNSSQSLWSLLLHQSNMAYGVNGMFTGAAIVFFAFVGFDVVASSAEETKNPKKALPVGIVGGVSILAFLYIVVSFVVLGMAPYNGMKEFAAEHNTSPTLATAFEMNGINWAGIIVAIGAVIGIVAVIILFIYGSTRIIFAISRDRLLPNWFAETRGKNNTPMRATILIVIVVLIMSSLLNLSELAELVNIGTLSAFAIISFSIPAIRKNKEFDPSFKTPLSPVLPIISGLGCIWLILNLPIITWIRFAAWLIIGLIIFFTYSRKHSLLNKK